MGEPLRQKVAFEAAGPVDDDLWLALGGRHWDDSLAEFIRPYLAELVTRGANQALENFGMAAGFQIEAPAAQEFVKRHAYEFARGINQATADRVRAAVETAISEGQTFRELTEALSFLPETSAEAGYRAQMVAQTEYHRAMLKGELEGWKQAGVVRKIWRANPGACEYCAAMDGTEVSVEAVYARAGDEITGAETGGTFKVSAYDTMDISQLHPWCRCQSEPVFEDE